MCPGTSMTGSQEPTTDIASADCGRPGPSRPREPSPGKKAARSKRPRPVPPGEAPNQADRIMRCRNLAQLERLYRSRNVWNALERELLFRAFTELTRHRKRFRFGVGVTKMVTRLQEARTNLPTIPEECTGMDDLEALALRDPAMDKDLKKRWYLRLFRLEEQERELAMEDEEMRQILAGNPHILTLMDGEGSRDGVVSVNGTDAVIGMEPIT